MNNLRNTTLTGTPPALGFVLLLAGLSTIGPFTIDTYLPSFHEIGESLHVSQVAVQQTLTAYLAAFALMTLWHGALSDRFGRRRVILVGGVAFTLASLGCALAQSLPQLLLFRTLQGLCAGAGLIVARAVIRDCYDGAAAQRLMSTTGMLFAIAPAIAPSIGGVLQHYFGWRSVFIFLATFSGLLCFACYRALPETLPIEKRQSFAPRALLIAYRQVFGQVSFLIVSFALALSFCGFFLYVLSAPAFLMTHLHVQETQFYLLFIPATFGMICGSWFSGRIAVLWHPSRTLRLGFILMLSAALVNVLLNLVLPPRLPWAIAPLPFYTFGMALSMPTLSLLALDHFPLRRGMAASCQSFIHTFCAATAAAVIAPLLWPSPLYLAAGMLMSIVVATLILLRLPSTRIVA